MIPIPVNRIILILVLILITLASYSQEILFIGNIKCKGILFLGKYNKVVLININGNVSNYINENNVKKILKDIKNGYDFLEPTDVKFILHKNGLDSILGNIFVNIVGEKYQEKKIILIKNKKVEFLEINDELLLLKVEGKNKLLLTLNYFKNKS